MQKNNNYQDDIRNCLRTLEQGGIIVYPTDTIWGVGCDATNHEAVKKIFAIKQRQEKKSMLVLVDDFERINDHVDKLPDVAESLATLSDRPVTIIYDNAINLAPNLVADDKTIGIRVAKDDFCEELIRRFRRPIVSTSANIAGEPFPRCYDDISREILDAADFVVGYRQDEISGAVPSSIIRLGSGGQVKIIRE